MNTNIKLSGSERKKLYMEEKPSFFYDNSEKDEVEILLDFYLSYTLRCAVDNHPNINPLVGYYAKRVLFTFLKNEIDEEKFKQLTIKEVKTWKQWERIDLIAEIEIEFDGTLINYALIFENKLYSNVHDEQLNLYKSIAENFYVNHPLKNNYKRLYFFLSCLEDVPEVDFSACKIANFTPLTFQDIRDSLASDARTGDSLFDEFWFRYY